MNSGQLTLESMSQALWYNRWTLKQFRSYLTGEVLEVGCGIGTFTRQLENYGRVWGIDIDRSNLTLAKKSVRLAKVGVGDIELGKYFFKDQKFSSIVCLNVLEHIENDVKALENIRKLLKPKGHLVLLVPIHQLLFGEIDRAIGHHRRYHKQRLVKAMEKIGFKIVSARRMNFLGGLGWFISSRIFKSRIVDPQKIKLFNWIAPLALPFEKLIEPPFGTSVLIVAQK